MNNNNHDIEQELNQEISQVGTPGASKRFLDMLHDRFSASDIVKIKNPMSVKTGWIYSEKTEVNQISPSTQRVYHSTPKVETLDPGEERNMEGWKAYIALGRMWKQYAQIEYQGEKMSANMVSQENRLAFIKKAFLGKVDLNGLAATQEPQESKEKPSKKPSKKPTNKPKPDDKGGDKPNKKDDLGFAEE